MLYEVITTDAKIPVQLSCVFSPAADFDHQVGWFFLFIAKYGLLIIPGWIDNKIFYEKRFFFSCLWVHSGKRMPPPVISLERQDTIQHITILIVFFIA